MVNLKMVILAPFCFASHLMYNSHTINWNLAHLIIRIYSSSSSSHRISQIHIIIATRARVYLQYFPKRAHTKKNDAFACKCAIAQKWSRIFFLILQILLTTSTEQAKKYIFMATQKKR